MIRKNLPLRQANLFCRRSFLKTAFAGGVSLCSLPFGLGATSHLKGRTGFRLSLETPTRLFDGKFCWAHPRAGIVPLAGIRGMPRLVMTMNLLDLSGSDVFRGMYGLYSDDLGKTWSPPVEQGPLSPRFENIDGEERPVAVSDFWPAWHQASGKLLGIGHTVAYSPEWKVPAIRPRHTAWSVYDPDSKAWAPWQKLEMPPGEKFFNAGAGCVQRFDLPDGTILLPMSFKPGGGSSRVTVAKVHFDGTQLKYLGHGDEIAVDDGTRGLGEPSLANFGGEYFLTIRNDNLAFVARSFDGQHFSPLQPWLFDDGEQLGSYNTQQHWVTHSTGLFLVYTRRGANNDHVFRHRAPLFIARVDTKRLRVIRSSELILVPNRGARLGNFGVTDVNARETWVTVAEWMQPHGVEKYGSDGSVFVARIKWDKPR